MNKNKIGDIPEELVDNKLLYGPQDTIAPKGGHSAEDRSPLEANQMARRKALIRIQEHLLLVFPAAGFLVAYTPKFRLNFFHLTKMEFTVSVAPNPVTIWWGSSSDAAGANAQFISPLHTNLALNTYIQKDFAVNPLTALQSGDLLLCNANAPCTISGEIVGWESPEEWSVDLPIR